MASTMSSHYYKRPSNVLREHHSQLCKILDSDDTTLLSLTLALYSRGIIDSLTKNHVFRKKGLEGADTLISRAILVLEKYPEKKEGVFESMEYHGILKPIVQKMRKSTKARNLDFYTERKVNKTIKRDEAKGKMKVSCLLLHGAPRVGKTCVKRLILNQPPEEQDSTRLVENAVRAISTGRLITTGTGHNTTLKEINEEEMIRMLRREIHKHMGEDESDGDDEAADGQQNMDLEEVDIDIASVVIDLAIDLDALRAEDVSFFNCHHVHLVDSGGQPQFSDLLPLVLQSQSHDHIVVIRLDEKLDDTPHNRLMKDGINYSFPEKLVLTNRQLIERACQLAKASNSRVIVVGTHYDKMSQEEPLEMKNELLNGLAKKYEENFVLNEDKQVIFAVNTMAPVGDERTRYSRMLQTAITDDLSCVGCCDDSDDDDDDLGQTMKMDSVPLRWIAFELEMSRRAKKSDGIILKRECDAIAAQFGISDSSKPLQFFTELDLHYYYPEVLPHLVFTSVKPISSRLSEIVEVFYLEYIEKKRRRVKVDPGEFPMNLFLRLTKQNSLYSKDDNFPCKDFLHLIKHLNIVFDIDDAKKPVLFVPCLLPLESDDDPSDCNYHPHELLCYWTDENGLKILPQSFFHALIVSLLKGGSVTLVNSDLQSRVAITLNFKYELPTEGRTDCNIQLIDFNSCLGIVAEAILTPKECPSVISMIRSSSRCVLKQLKIEDSYSTFRYGLKCPKCADAAIHPGAYNRELREPGTGSSTLFRCVQNRLCTWTVKDTFWFDYMDEYGDKKECSSNSLKISTQGSKLPTLTNLRTILENKSAEWYSIGQGLDVKYNFREELRTSSDGTGGSLRKLEAVLNEWIESRSSPVTWQEFKKVLEKMEYKDCAREVDEIIRAI